MRTTTGLVSLIHCSCALVRQEASVAVTSWSRRNFSSLGKKCTDRQSHLLCRNQWPVTCTSEQEGGGARRSWWQNKLLRKVQLREREKVSQIWSHTFKDTYTGSKTWKLYIWLSEEKKKWTRHLVPFGASTVELGGTHASVFCKPSFSGFAFIFRLLLCSSHLSLYLWVVIGKYGN